GVRAPVQRVSVGLPAAWRDLRPLWTRDGEGTLVPTTGDRRQRRPGAGLPRLGGDRKEPPMRARDLMTAPVITVQPWTSAKEAAELLSLHGFTALPVIDDDDHLIGIVTEADLIRGRIPV